MTDPQTRPFFNDSGFNSDLAVMLHRQCWRLEFEVRIGWDDSPMINGAWSVWWLIEETFGNRRNQKASNSTAVWNRHSRVSAISSDILKRSVVNNLVLPVHSSLYLSEKKENILLEVIRSSGVLSKRLEFWGLAVSIWLLLCRRNSWGGGWSSWQGSYSEVAFVYFLTDLAQCRQKWCMFPDIGPVMYGLTFQMREHVLCGCE